MNQKVLVSLVCLVAMCSSVFGQAGVSSSSVGVSKAGLSRTTPDGRFRLPPPEYFRVEEFVNYHRHNLPLPTEGDRALLDVKQAIVSDNKTIVQFGITTPRAIDPEKMPLLNVVLVIDQSGSMSGERISKVKKSIHAFVERFRPNDRISIVGFSNSVKTHLSGCEKTDLGRIQKAIDGIAAGGSTNLHAGLMLGYKIADEHFDKERTNRVILLTDGIANVGTTGTNEIAKQSKVYNDKGISLSTIGLGDNFNHDLLRKLSDTGKGLIHFVNDTSDIQKTFVSEVDALLAPAAEKVTLEVHFKKNCQVKVFGYEPKVINDRYFFELDNLNHGATQVVMMAIEGELPKTTAKLTYVDSVTRENKAVKVKQSGFQVSTKGPFDIRRNYGIALVAQSLRDAAVQSNKGDCRKAEQILKCGMDEGKILIDNVADEHLDRVVKIAKDYRSKILDCIERLGD